ncbi:MAG: anion permease [Acidobacteria bacterium]|nr:anion permease [Acidobacteriota bacterium]
MPWQDLAEMAPMLSEAEVRFEKKRRLVGLFWGPLVFVLLLLAPPLEHVSPVGMRSLAIFTLAVILTNLVTNVAVISAMGPIAIAVAPTVGLNPVALTVTISLASVIGYSTPMANPPCAIVFASGYVRILPMLRRGIVLSVVGILLLSFVGYPIINWIFPWPPPAL